jgi:Zn-dependent peptidase ImmA (M78 family)
MRTTRAEREAEKLLNEFAVRHPPVDVLKLARRLGTEVRATPLKGDLSALIYRRGSRPLIIVNSRDYENRQRFSLAHEVGHLVLHRDDNVFVDQVLRRDKKSSLGVDRKEVEANQFAAALLMPRTWIQKEVQKRVARRSPGDELVKELATVFTVSPEAMRHRLVNLGIVGTA